MKKHLSLISVIIVTSLILGLGLMQVSAAETDSSAPYYKSAEDVTIAKICEKLTPSKILETVSNYSIAIAVSNMNDSNLTTGSFIIRYAKDGDTYFYNEFADYADGYFNHLFFSTDPDDVNIYVETPSGSSRQQASAEKIKASLEVSFIQYEYFEDVKITSVEETADGYLAVIECKMNDKPYFTDRLTIDPESGLISLIETNYFDEESNPADSISQTLSYNNETGVDSSPKDHYLASQAEGLHFSTKDFDGNPVSLEDYKDASVIMINLWEPWCNPCVGEMPALEQLYENYKDQGFLILGVYSTEGSDDDIRAILEDTGVSYPIIKMDANLANLRTGYVPTSVFIDGNGQYLSEAPLTSARSYDEWEEILKGYLD